MTIMRSIAIAHAKGGTGKTTLAVHVACGMAREGKRVVLVDLDAQGSATLWLLGKLPSDPGAADALRGALPSGALHDVPGRAGLCLLPATAALASVDLALAAEVAGETLLRGALRQLPRCEYVILDCPPNLGITVLSALCAADGVVAPVPASFLSLAGLRRLDDTVHRVRERLGADVRMLGYVLFAADVREGITLETRDLLRREVGDRLFDAEVRLSTAAKALPARRATAWDDGADPRGAQDYPFVLDEIIRRLDARKGKR